MRRVAVAVRVIVLGERARAPRLERLAHGREAPERDAVAADPTVRQRAARRLPHELVAAQLDIPAGTSVQLPVDPTFEHGVLLDSGELDVEGTALEPAWLAYLAPGREVIELRAGAQPVRAVLMGGTPFEEQILMWWNFVGRTHEEVVAARAQWQDAIDGDPEALARFGAVTGYDGPPLPAPQLPQVRLKPRRQPGVG